MRAIDADTDSNMNAPSAIDASINSRNGIKITLSDAKQRSMAADGTRSPFVGHRRGTTTDDGKNRRGETVIRKIQFLHNNVVFFLVPLLLMILKETSALPPIIKIGAIFSEEQKHSHIELAFKYAVHKINRDRVILPKTTLVYDIQYVPKEDSFHATKKVCNQVKMGVQAIFGPSDPTLGAHIYSICDALDIPYLDARIDTHSGGISSSSSSSSSSSFASTRSSGGKDGATVDSRSDGVDTSSRTVASPLVDRYRREFTINLNPTQLLVNNAFEDVIRFLNWTNVAIIYERSYDLMKLRELVRTSGFEVYLRQADPSSYLNVLKDIKMKEIFNIIIDIQPENMVNLLNVILQLQMNEYKYHYLYTTLDIDAFDLDDFKYNFVNITAFRLVDVDDIGVREIIKDMRRFQQKQLQKQPNQSSPEMNPKPSKFIGTESALMYDAVHIFAIGLQTLEQSHTLRLSNISCADEKPWDGGLSLINYINAVEWKGLSGPIEFKEGRRIEFKLDLVKLKQQSLVKVGEWSPQIGLNITDRSIFFDTGRINVTLLVITILEIPYVMMHYGKNLTGNERFFGFCVDILARVANEVGFEYILDLAPDKKYGAKDPNTGEWNGMVFQLMKHETPYVMLRRPLSSHPNPSLVGAASDETPSSMLLDQRRRRRHEEPFPSTVQSFTSNDYENVHYLNDDENVNINVNRKLTPSSAQASTSANNIEQTMPPTSSLPPPSTSSTIPPPSSNEFNQNELFEGFCIDILRLIAKMVGFEYNIKLVPDGKYGVYDLETGEWNGIVRELMDKKADLAVGSMTINYARESVIDFTKPFMNLGISILFKVPTAQPTRLFSFMNPLSIDIWLYVLAAYCLVSLSIYIVARFSEWHNAHPCDIENDIIENQFTIANSFWFAIGTLMQQGSDLNPKATSTRIVSGIWWFFTLIIISSYTANLAAFLTVERMITPIENAEDLAGQTEISYGTLESGSTMTFFRDSMIETYKKMWRFMENKKPAVFTTTYEEGIRRVLEGNYAFLMESTMLDYIVQRDCNLTQIGGLLDTKGYGIATPMGSPWRDKISLAILELQEKGEIQMLYDKWWKSPKDQCADEKAKQSNKANALGVNNIGGVFVVLLCGLAFAVLIAILEFCHNSRHQQKQLSYIDNMCMNGSGESANTSTNFLDTDSTMSQLNATHANDNRYLQHRSLFSDMTDELCLAIRCQGSRQRAVFRRECSKCKHVRKQFSQNERIAANATNSLLDHSKITPSLSTTMPAAPPPPSTSAQKHSTQHECELYEMREFNNIYDNRI